MDKSSFVFDEPHVLKHIAHYLPHQAALKDFVHHNTLHAFQNLPFHKALEKANQIFGFTTYLSLNEYREMYASNKINKVILEQKVEGFLLKNESFQKETVLNNLLHKNYTTFPKQKIGEIRSKWKAEYSINLDKVVHPLLFRSIAGFLDQGIASWSFPYADKPFLEAIQEIENETQIHFFQSKRVKKLLSNKALTISSLLDILIGNAAFYEAYLFDQQFAHPGWSGFVSILESQPETLLKQRKISLKDLVIFELLLEIDALDNLYGENWKPLCYNETLSAPEYFNTEEKLDVFQMLSIWQAAFEWSYFDAVLSGVQTSKPNDKIEKPSFQGLFCIDDREYSFRRNLELCDPNCETFGTPGFFGVEFFFQPENGKFYTKACPAPVTPKFLIKELGRKTSHSNDAHFSSKTHGLFRGFLYASAMGFISIVKLILNIFKPSISPATAYSFQHMDKHSQLLILSEGNTENHLHIGFTVEEMALRVKNVLKSIGLTRNFSDLVYIVGHGGSSVNNTYYAGYDCGACCGRPGAVNARVFSFMANKSEVRQILMQDDIVIPDTTIFVGAMRDTTRDEIEFYDEDLILSHLKDLHANNKKHFLTALEKNAFERSFRFDTLNSHQPLSRLHTQVKNRSVSLFEPRPEWNHTANALCIVGRKSLYQNVYLDKRPFLNSYDYEQDPEGIYLGNILSAAIPVCGGINLEYYFSRVDQQKLGAGTKLPHNVVGLFAVANGTDGDLRPGLPSQMVEIHDPVRILFIIEQDPALVLKVLKASPNLYEWVANEWVLFSVKDPKNERVYIFENGAFIQYNPFTVCSTASSDDSQLFKAYEKSQVFAIQ